MCFRLGAPARARARAFPGSWCGRDCPSINRLRRVNAEGLTVHMDRWKMLDHGAHLTGVLCGYVFVHGGYTAAVRLQNNCSKQWRAVRPSR